MSPNFGFGAAGGVVGEAGAMAVAAGVFVAAPDSITGAGCSPCFGSSVLWWTSASVPRSMSDSVGSGGGSFAKACVGTKAVASSPDSPNSCSARPMVDPSSRVLVVQTVCPRTVTELLPVVGALAVLALEVLAHEVFGQP